MIKLTKNVLGAGAAAAALVTMSVPAQARDDYRKRDGISAGEVIAGVVVLGGIAAVLSSKSNNDRYDDGNYRGDDRYNSNNRYDYGNDGGQAAVNKCIRNVERDSSKYNRTKVTDIRIVDRTRNGYKVTGRIVVQDDYGRGDNYGRGGGYDDNRHYDRGNNRNYDTGRFTCYVERGRVVDIDYNSRNNWR